MKHVFIVGCPRSGSTWTTFLLSHHPQVATFQHAKVFDYLVKMERWHHNKAGFSYIVNTSGEATADSGDGDTKRLKQAGVFPNDIAASERYLRRIGFQRAERLLTNLVKADGNMKGGRRISDRLQVEQLLFVLSGTADDIVLS